MDPKNILIAKRDLETYSTKDLNTLAKYYNLSGIRNDLCWLLSMNILGHSHKARMNGEEAQRRVDEWIRRNDTTEPLDLAKLGLTELPPLPAELTRLYCYGNNLTELPELPTNSQSFHLYLYT